MDLVESARQWVLQNLPHDTTDVDLVTYLNGLGASELLARYHNWMSRLVRPQPRQVFKSSALMSNPIASARASQLAQIISDIEAGRDVSKYLSRAIKVGVQHPSDRRRQDLDLMLNDWGVHHLHVSTVIEADGFVERVDALLFAVFKPTKAYLIDIMQHGGWTRDHVLETIVNEWPNDGLIHELHGSIGLSNPVSEQDRKTLRRKHVNTLFEYNGKVYMPDGGISTAGTTVQAIREADRVVIELEDLENRVRADSGYFPRLFKENGIAYPKDPIFEFKILESGVGILEAKTGTWLPLLGGHP